MQKMPEFRDNGFQQIADSIFQFLGLIETSPLVSHWISLVPHPSPLSQRVFIGFDN